MNRKRPGVSDVDVDEEDASMRRWRADYEAFSEARRERLCSEYEPNEAERAAISAEGDRLAAERLRLWPSGRHR